MNSKKNALVLGITGKLGEKITQTLISEGYFIIGSYRSEEKINGLLFDEDLLPLKLDLSSKESINSFLEKVSDKKIDLFINTIANKLTFDRFENTSQEIFEKDIQINFLNPIYLLRKLFQNFNKESSIIFVLTEMIYRPQGYFSSYIASKYALLGLIKSISLEFKTKGIRVNSISPGMMDTPFISNLPPLLREKYVSSSKSKEFVSLEEVCSKLVEIIKDNSINGEDIKIF